VDRGLSLLAEGTAMSEFQYYEFRALDRSLTPREMRELGAISTRAEITPTSFVNTYEWGDLKGDPNRFMEKYFDAFVYVANWGMREFMLRLPEKALDRRTIAAYCPGDNLDARWVNHFLILRFFCEGENGDDWDDGGRWMSSLITLRADVMRGDMRSLYLGWLLCAQDEAFDEEELEPPVPPGLGKLTPPLESLASFLGLEQDLLQTAAKLSSELPGDGRIHRSRLEAWINAMPEKEKNTLLLELTEKDISFARNVLLQRFEHARNPARHHVGGQEPTRRTVGHILASAEMCAAKRRQREEELAAAEQLRLEQREAAARTKHLGKLAGREAQIWEQTDALIQTKQPNNYARAIHHLIDLRDLAVRRGQESGFASNLGRLRENHQQKPSFVRRLADAGF
jgi:hypothetical protein